MTVKIKYNKAHVLYKALGYDHWTLDTKSCTMQDFSTGLDLDSDPLIEMYVIGTDRNPSVKWVQ